MKKSIFLTIFLLSLLFSSSASAQGKVEVDVTPDRSYVFQCCDAPLYVWFAADQNGERRRRRVSSELFGGNFPGELISIELLDSTDVFIANGIDSNNSIRTNNKGQIVIDMEKINAIRPMPMGARYRVRARVRQRRAYDTKSRSTSDRVYTETFEF